jgi:hypothetical protein
MNLELTTMPSLNRQFPDVKAFLSTQLGKIRQAFRFHAPKLPQKPAVRHPLESLTFYNGTICHVCHERPAGEYLPLSGIEIIGKLSWKELDDERCEYRLVMNLATDLVWRCFFKWVQPELPVSFEGKGLVLTCLPSDLELSYQGIKNAIAQANLWYAEEREQLILRVIARDEAREAAREMEENRQTGLRRQFECLDL